MAKKVKFKLISVSLGLFLLGIGALILVPGLLALAQDKLVSSRVIDDPQVAGVKTKIEVIDKKIPPPNFSALSVIAMDYDSGQIFFQKNIHQRLYPASTTKMLSALVAVDYFKAADILEVPPEALVGGSSMGLHSGERLTFRSLLYGMLLNSGNDAAYTVALNYPGGLEGFVGAMNKKVSDLGLTDSHFSNPAGLDDPTQYSSAFDLVKIAHAASINSEVSIVVSTKKTEVSSLDSRVHPLENLNKLLDIEGVIGFKTGTTPEAGENFIGLVERKNHRVLTAVLGSQNRFLETKELMDWVYSNFDWTETVQ